MIDYSAGSKRTSENFSATSTNSSKLRAVTDGSMSMNINTGGPHLLLFERDQQLAALLMSEFQLAGYECHTARTAVEVFDAIARYPIRLVLVNLAQAAAGRREFWVALDAQRRGRGVQVFTFRCMNLASYGPDDPDDRSRTVLANLEVDGMLGVMNLVNAVRSRLPATTTGSFAHAASPIVSNPDSSIQRSQQTVDRIQEEIPALNRQTQIEKEAVLTPPLITQSAVPLTPDNTAAGQSAAPPPSGQQQVPSIGFSGTATPTFTDKIRAVIYPGSRNVSPKQEANAQNPAASNLAPASTSRVAGNQEPVSSRLQDVSTRSIDEPAMLNRQTTVDRPGRQNSVISEPSYQTSSSSSMPPEIDRLVSAEMEPPPPSEEESGLAQLSRMVRDQGMPVQDTVAVPTNRETPPTGEPQTRTGRDAVRTGDSPSLSSLPLRPSPIQDIPLERNSEHRHAISGQTSKREAQTIQPPKRPDGASIAQLPPSPMPIPPLTPVAPSATIQSKSPTVPRLESVESIKAALSSPDDKSSAEPNTSRNAMELTQPNVQTVSRRHLETGTNVASDDTLLNIVQSLPPMSSPPPQPPVLRGRATRSLGSVLLEGHLVPQERLEVAQNIQRMLRGVDMNYQLGEILLMFKLLTPDQLLAASLVSYGLISTAQISALGRIRQELYAIGLDYDLESLLILFRILTPEQLREVRSSWSG